MTTVQRNRALLLGVAITVVGASGCKKYPDGPAFSLKSKKARLTGEWEVTDGPSQMMNNVDDVIFEFEDDGDFTFSATYTYSYYGYSYSYDFSESGEWEFSGDKEEVEIDMDNVDDMDFEILRLTNSELFLEDEDGNDWEMEKQ